MVCLMTVDQLMQEIKMLKEEDKMQLFRAPKQELDIYDSSAVAWAWHENHEAAKRLMVLIQNNEADLEAAR